MAKCLFLTGANKCDSPINPMTENGSLKLLVGDVKKALYANLTTRQSVVDKKGNMIDNMLDICNTQNLDRCPFSDAHSQPYTPSPCPHCNKHEDYNKMPLISLMCSYWNNTYECVSPTFPQTNGGSVRILADNVGDALYADPTTRHIVVNSSSKNKIDHMEGTICNSHYYTSCPYSSAYNQPSSQPSPCPHCSGTGMVQGNEGPQY